jgi:hypothetical protein
MTKKKGTNPIGNVLISDKQWKDFLPIWNSKWKNEFGKHILDEEAMMIIM